MTFIPMMFYNIFLLKKKKPKLKIYTYKSLVETVKKRNDTCHVIATGYSAISSYKLNIIRKDDYIIGFNFAAFLPYNFDFYFCEENSRVDISDDRTKNQAVLLRRRGKNISNLIFKNLYDSKPNLMTILISNEYSIVMDIQIVSGNINKLLAKPSIMMHQHGSTVITAVILAYHAGFKNIIVHGLDFSGPHIYHDEGLQKQIGLSAPTPYVSKETTHITASLQELVWPNIIKEFREREVKIFSACPESKFSEYAPVYQPPHSHTK
jgi:hypothetical protein